jgi:hypothetical protein
MKDKFSFIEFKKPSYDEISSNLLSLNRFKMIAHSIPSVSATSDEKDKYPLFFN